MIHQAHSPEEVGRIGDEIYNRELWPRVMPHCEDKFLALDINTGAYEIDDEDLAATRRLQARVPDGGIYGLRIGYRAAYSLAGQLLDEPE